MFSRLRGLDRSGELGENTRNWSDPVYHLLSVEERSGTYSTTLSV